MVVDSYIPPQIEVSSVADAPYIFDRKIADVTGDKIEDFIYLAGSKQSADAIYQEDIQIIVVDGVTNEVVEQMLDLNGGYGSLLFVGDFDQNGVDDVYVSISSGGSGNIHYYYIYSFCDKQITSLLDYHTINELYEWTVTFIDDYGGLVTNQTLDKTYKLDLSQKESEFLERYYDSEGKVKSELQGAVLELGDLYPVMPVGGQSHYDLLASQKIVGSVTSDQIGVVEIYFTYKEGQFTPYEMVVGEAMKVESNCEE